MRRSDKEITDTQELHDILNANTVLHLALTDGDQPYIVPMNYGFTGNAFYLHSALKGKKLDIIQENPRAAFEVSDSIELIRLESACLFTTHYRSVTGFGEIHFADTYEEKKRGLESILLQHTGSADWELPGKGIDAICMLRLDISSMTGKKSGNARS